MDPTMPHDAIIIGGSYAGLNAAMQLARARRRVLVIDDNRPRNRFAARAHGVMGRDGVPGSEIAAEARAQVSAYPTAAFRRGEVVNARKGRCGFEVDLADGARVTGRRLMLAYGVQDILPDLPGVKERWGRTVLHCPYCHGYEIGGGPIGVLGAGPMSVHQAVMVAEWGQVVLFLDGKLEPDADQSRMLARRGVTVEATPVAALEGEGPALDGARLADGRLVPLKAVFVGPRLRLNGDLAQALGCEIEDTPVGQMIRTDEMKQTTVPGVFAAGDAARVMSNVTLAAADGVMAGIALHRSLIEEDAA
ncbi:NAD(P)/FAD-dependent oxidoreductase [Brevundimonas sp.]|uniref:NAD(P)/FAD-dependent oxidoreductase n=1 Tax=Brevundimonas sp. TaxID=1871086 RepID=UPI0025C5CDDA|nr:NAD(P)/FAD-dependent oxidoreductase [Brevundimonas sp.]